MKTNRNNNYQAISSFVGFRFESERLDLKGKLLESKIRMNIYQIKQELTSSSLGTSLLNDLGIQRVAEFIKEVLDRRTL